MSYVARVPRIVAPALLVAALACCTAGPDGVGENARPAGSPGSATGADEVTREQAIEIARKQVSFAPRSIEAVAEEGDGRPLWRVTFRGRPPGPEHAMGEFQEILIDRRTGEVVSLAMS